MNKVGIGWKGNLIRTPMKNEFATEVGAHSLEEEKDFGLDSQVKIL